MAIEFGFVEFVVCLLALGENSVITVHRGQKFMEDVTVRIVTT